MHGNPRARQSSMTGLPTLPPRVRVRDLRDPWCGFVSSHGHKMHRKAVEAICPIVLLLVLLLGAAKKSESQH